MRMAEAALRPLEHQGQIARVHVIELRARALLEEIGIDGARPQELHAMLPGGALALELVELVREVGGLLHQILAGAQTVLAGMRMRPEIGDDQRGPGIKAKRALDRTGAAATDHAADDGGSTLTRL